MNYYWRPGFPKSVQVLYASLALHMAVETKLANAIALVDGSPEGRSAHVHPLPRTGSSIPAR